MKKLIIGIILIFILTILVIINVKKDKVKIHVFNAGKADCSVLTYKDLTIIIDTGEEDLYDDISKYLNKNKIDTIDYLIITHFDKDHVGSAYKILENKKVLNVVQTNTKKDSIYYEKYIEALNSNDINPITVIDNYEINYKNLKIVINGPNKIYNKNESNNSSLITSIYYKKNSLIFMGDSEKDRLKDFISFNEKEYDLVKIPYHGNYQKQLNNLMDNIKPKYAIISDNKIEDKMIDILKENNIKYYMTGNGSIDIISNGKKIKINQ